MKEPLPTSSIALTLPRTSTPKMTIRERKKLLANLPLETKWKVLTFLIPGFIQMLKLKKYVTYGYERRAMELMKWTWYGVNFYNSVIAMIAIYQAVFVWQWWHWPLVNCSVSVKSESESFPGEISPGPKQL